MYILLFTITSSTTQNKGSVTFVVIQEEKSFLRQRVHYTYIHLCIYVLPLTIQREPILFLFDLTNLQHRTQQDKVELKDVSFYFRCFIGYHIIIFGYVI